MGYEGSRKAARRRVVPIEELVDQDPPGEGGILGLFFLVAAMVGAVIGILLAHGALP